MRVRLSSAVALCAVIASCVFFSGCAVNESGNIPCVDDSSCPADYPTCTAGKCVGPTPPPKSTPATSGGKEVVTLEKDVLAENTATIAALSVGSPLTVYGNQNVMVGGSITMPPGGGPPPTGITISLTLSENCPTGMHVVPVISTDFSVTPNARIPDKILPVPSLVDCVGNTSSPGEPRVISPGSFVLLSATPHKYGLPAGTTLELTASDYTCPLEAASCATAFVDNHTCVADNQCFSNYCSPTLHVCTFPPCPSPETRCSAGGFCTNLLTDPANCGVCGTACPAGELCSDGKCAVCPSSSDKVCNNACVDTTTDGKNCGSCGNACLTGQTCTAGTCATVCGFGATLCGSACVNLQSDNSNCGACGTACASGTSCNSGTCGTTCLVSETKCGTGPAAICTSPSSDDQNCGSCGHVCPAGTACNSGTCGTTCGSGLTNCSGMCTSTMIDPNNCNACGATCASPTNGKGVCIGSACGVACNGGYTLCGTACDNTATDPNHCGACSHACIAPVFGAATCTNGGCGFSCPAGDALCTTPTSSLPICCTTGSSCSLTCPH